MTSAWINFLRKLKMKFLWIEVSLVSGCRLTKTWNLLPSLFIEKNLEISVMRTC